MKDTYIIKADMTDSESRIATIQASIESVMRMYKQHKLNFRGDFTAEFYMAIVGFMRDYVYKRETPNEVMLDDMKFFMTKGMEYWELKDKEKK